MRPAGLGSILEEFLNYLLAGDRRPEWALGWSYWLQPSCLRPMSLPACLGVAASSDGLGRTQLDVGVGWSGGGVRWAKGEERALPCPWPRLPLVSSGLLCIFPALQNHRFRLAKVERRPLVSPSSLECLGWGGVVVGCSSTPQFCPPDRTAPGMPMSGRTSHRVCGAPSVRKLLSLETATAEWETKPQGFLIMHLPPCVTTQAAPIKPALLPESPGPSRPHPVCLLDLGWKADLSRAPPRSPQPPPLLLHVSCYHQGHQ